MSNEQIRTLLGKLQDELQKTKIDSETHELLQDLDSSLHGLLDPQSMEGDSQSVLERAQELESRFATSHPVAERVVREIIDALARMGV